MKIKLRDILWGVAIVFAATVVQARTWTDTQGRTLEAELASVNSDRVNLRKPDGKLVTVRVSQLSRSDRQWLDRHRASTRKPQDGSASTPKVEVSAAWSEARHMVNDKFLPPDVVIEVRVTGDRIKEATHYGMVMVSEAEAGGRKLKLRAPFNAFKDSSKRMLEIDRKSRLDKHPTNGLLAKLSFEHPGEITEFTRVKGTMRIRTSDGKEAVVPFEGRGLKVEKR